MRHDLPDDLRRALEVETARERRLWMGRTDGRLEVLAAFAIWGFAIPWTAFALFWESMVIGGLLFSGEAGGMGVVMGSVMALFGLPFVLIGLAMLSTPWFAWRSASRTAWAITDRRLVCLTLGRTLQVASWEGHQIADVSRRERADGSGDVTVSLGFTRDSDGDRVEVKKTLRGVRDVRAVEAALRSIIRARSEDARAVGALAAA